MRNAVTAVAIVALLILTVGCAGTSSGVDFYGTTGYYPSLYADPFLTPGFPPTRIDTAWDLALPSIRARSLIRQPSCPRIGHPPIGMVGMGPAATIAARWLYGLKRDHAVLKERMADVWGLLRPNIQETVRF